MLRTLSIALCLAGCAADVTSDETFSFLEPPPGKADGEQALLPDADLQRLDDRLTAAIAAADQQIASLESQIAAAEQQLATKQSRVDSLVQQIQDRQQQVTNNYNNSFMISAFAAAFGLAPVWALSLTQTLQNDQLLQSLNQQLSDAKVQRDQVKQQIVSYQRKRDALRAPLDKLKSTYALLKMLLASPSPAQVGARPDDISDEDWGQLAARRGRVDVLSRVLDNAKQQVALLQQILSLAQAANAAVDQAVKTVQALADAADAEARKSADGMNQLLKLLLAGDGDAQSFLDDLLAQKTRQALKSLGWPSDRFVEFLVSGDADLEGALLDVLNTTITMKAAKPAFKVGEKIVVSFAAGPGGINDWVGIYPRGQAPSPASVIWVYAGAAPGTPQEAAAPKSDGTVSLGAGSDGESGWPLAAGDWTAHYLANDGYSSLASADFAVR